MVLMPNYEYDRNREMALAKGKVRKKLIKPKITEAAFTSQVIKLAQTLGWKTAHFRPGMTSRIGKEGEAIWVTPVQGDGVGFPDLVMIRQGRLVVAELKSENGIISTAQIKWLEAFDTLKIGIEVYLWHPAQFEEIAEILNNRAGGSEEEPNSKVNLGRAGGGFAVKGKMS